MLPGQTPSTDSGTIKKPLTMIKPSLPTVKLPPGISSAGPPPLAAVNTSANISSTISSQSSSSSDANRKDDIPRTSTPTSAPPAATTQTAVQATSNVLTASTLAAPSLMTSAPTTTSTAHAVVSCTTTSTPQLQPQQQQNNQTQSSAAVIHATPQNQQLPTIDAQWLYICDWRNCPRKKFKSLGDLQHHVCTAHAPDHLDPAADIFCQWGVGPGLCDGLPRKRFSLMTHLIDHHLTLDSLRTAVQRRIATGMYNLAPALPPVTIVRNTELAQRANNASPSPSTSSSSSSQNASCLSALQAIKRHTDLTNSKELMDENEGPVTKSIRLTASLILRNLVSYTATAKRSVRRYEPHLANIALSNVESSATISNILYEMNG